MTYDLYCEADVVVECSLSGTSSRYPVSFNAGKVSSLSSVDDAITLPAPEALLTPGKLGTRLAYVEITGVRIYHAGTFLLGGYLSPVAKGVQWVKPVLRPDQRQHLECLVAELALRANNASYMAHLARHSAQMIALALVGDAHPFGDLTYLGTAPERFANV